MTISIITNLCIPDYHDNNRRISRDTIEAMSTLRREPYWMIEFRLRSYDTFESRPTPNWGCDLSKIDFRNIYCHARTTKKPESDAYWSDTFGTKNTKRKKFLPSTVIEHEYQAVCCNLKENLEKEGVIFVGIKTAIKDYPELVEKYFGKVIPPDDNKFAALNSAIWSGGSFIYLPPNVKNKVPIRSDCRINGENSI
jgi:Fe-S cluster assembly protein SufB